MKKLVVSVLITFNIFVASNAMEPQADLVFFESLEPCNQYALLLAILNQKLAHPFEQDDLCLEALLPSMIAIFDYKTLPKRQENDDDASYPKSLVILLTKINVHEMINCAAQNGLEEIMNVILEQLEQDEELADKCDCIKYQSLAPLCTAIIDKIF